MQGDIGDAFDSVRLAFALVERPLLPTEYLDQPAKFLDALAFLAPFIQKHRDILSRTPRSNGHRAIET